MRSGGETAELSEEEFDELMVHVRDGHTEVVLEAVDRDRGLLARADQHGERLLDRAAFWGRADLVGELLDRGADITLEPMVAGMR